MIFVIDAISAEIITKKYYKEIYSYCYANLFFNDDGASEVTQEVFLFFHEQRETIEDTYIRAWLYKVARNKMGEYIRASKSRQKKFAELTEDSASISDSEIFVHLENDIDVSDEEILKCGEACAIMALSTADATSGLKCETEVKENYARFRR